MLKSVLSCFAALAVSALAADTPPSPPLYVIAADANGHGQFGKLNVADGSFFLVRNYETIFWGVTRSSEGFYVVDGAGLVSKLDATTGEPSTVGSTGVPTGGPFDVSFNAAGGMTDGRFFGLDSQSNLWSISLQTGKATLVGNVGVTPITSPAFGASLSGDDKFLYLTIEEDSIPPAAPVKLISPAIYRIDPNTASATRMGAIPSYIGGSAFANGKLYGFSVMVEDGNITGDGPVYEINTETGESKMLAIPAPCMGGGFGGTAAPPDPAPTAATLQLSDAKRTTTASKFGPAQVCGSCGRRR